jgi:hypothetical protein
MSSNAEIRDGLFLLSDSALVHAPIDRCFKLSCSLELVHEELGMNAVSGRTSGMVRGGDVVRWEGWQLGLRHHHVSQISSYEAPVFLQDTMLDGRFQYLQHDHHLRETADGTLLSDDLRFSLPFGALGRLVARYIMVPHIRKLLKSRFARIKRIAEGADWQKYVTA